MNINVFKALLKRTKISVDSAMSGPEALEMIKDNKYDIIFLDHMMPDMDGIETYKHMKELEESLNKDINSYHAHRQCHNGSKRRISRHRI